MDAYPSDLKQALTAGVACSVFIGLKSSWYRGCCARTNSFKTRQLVRTAVLLALAGIPLTAALLALRLPGAIPNRDSGSDVCRLLDTQRLETPAAPRPMAGCAGCNRPTLVVALDPGYLWRHLGAAFPALLSLVFIDLFSSLAAANAVCQRAGLTDEEGNMLRPMRILSADALATMGASLAGTTTTNVYGKSAAGWKAVDGQAGDSGGLAVLTGHVYPSAARHNPATGRGTSAGRGWPDNVQRSRGYRLFRSGYRRRGCLDRPAYGTYLHQQRHGHWAHRLCTGYVFGRKVALCALDGLPASLKFRTVFPAALAFQ